MKKQMMATIIAIGLFMGSTYTIAADSTSIKPPTDIKPMKATIDFSKVNYYRGNLHGKNIFLKCSEGEVVLQYQTSTEQEGSLYVLACVEPKIVYTEK